MPVLVLQRFQLVCSRRRTMKSTACQEWDMDIHFIFMAQRDESVMITLNLHAGQKQLDYTGGKIWAFCKHGQHANAGLAKNLAWWAGRGWASTEDKAVMSSQPLFLPVHSRITVMIVFRSLIHIPCVSTVRICVHMGICVGVWDCSDSTSITYRIHSLLILNGVTLRVTAIAKQLIKHITFVQMNCMLGDYIFLHVGGMSPLSCNLGWSHYSKKSVLYYTEHFSNPAHVTLLSCFSTKWPETHCLMITI